MIKFIRYKGKRSKELEKIEYDKRVKKSRTLPTLIPGDQPAYFYYRKHRKTNNKIGEDRTLFRKSVRCIYEAIGELMAEYEGGVQTSNYGYFVPIVLPWHKGNLTGGPEIMNLFHTDGRFYSPTFFHDTTKNSALKHMVMDYQFCQELKSRISKNIYKDFRPKLYYTTLKSLYGRKPVK